jgi:hypothetical protein
VAIDVFSGYALVEPLKNKTAKEVERGLIIILNQAKPRKIRNLKLFRKSSIYGFGTSDSNAYFLN